MRNIEFRGWDIDNKRWVYGYYVKWCDATPYPISTQYEHDEFVEKHSHHFIVQDGFSDWGLKRPLMKIDVDPKSVGQYIGQRDKNKKKVYEGDILELGNDRAIVEYNYTEFYAMSIEPNIQGNVSTWCNLIGDGTVLGNIYQNKIEQTPKGLVIHDL